MIRLNWFLPFLRKRRPGRRDIQLPIVLEASSRVLPKSWRADRDRGRPGKIRRVLKRMGPSVLSSPFRRLSQTICFGLFLYLFFFVCWPYSARPPEPGGVSASWNLVTADNDGTMKWAGSTIPDWLDSPAKVFVGIPSTPSRDAVDLGEFTVIERSKEHITLEPSEPLGGDSLDALLTETRTWSIFENQPGRWPSTHTDNLASKEYLPAELFLAIDPLVSLSTAIASRSWVWSLASAGIILLVCVFIPRGFCGYLCPLGTLIDLFDWSVTKRTKRFQVAEDGWWVHIKYYLLLGTLICAAAGVLVSGFFAAIPVITRGMLFFGEPLQVGVARGWHAVPPIQFGQVLSMLLFLAVLCLGFMRPRFWCKYVCPSGAVFSLGNLFRLSERKVESSCINCNRCVEVCPFDAIKPDFTTRTTDCTLCQTCGGVCPVHAIKFVDRFDGYDLKVENDPPTGETAIGRRGFLSAAIGTGAAAIGSAAAVSATHASNTTAIDPAQLPLVRPPGSVPEDEFLQMCIRCGECYKACPNNVLQPEGFQQGLAGLWTPMVNADWAGCESSCNACGQVCPTGAIRALALEEKKVARMGLAVLNRETCLPIAGKEACQLCVDECNAAGYEAIEFVTMHTQVDDQGEPIEGSGFLAPQVIDDKCVGCGLCQTRCNAINHQQKNMMGESAIIVIAGPENEDRIMDGSYLELRRRDRQTNEQTMDRSAREMMTDQNSKSPVETGGELETTDNDLDPFGLDADSAGASPTEDSDPFGLNEL